MQIGTVIDTLLECTSNLNNVVVASKGYNGFVVKSLLQLPVEVFSRAQRERILTSWNSYSAYPTIDDNVALPSQLTPLDPAIFSLKMKIMQRPTFYKGITFQELVDIADAITRLSDKQMVVLSIFVQYAQLTLG